MALDGGPGNDTIGGTANDEVINGLGGDDILDTSGGGIDTLNGGDGNDFLYIRNDYEGYGGNGNDIFLIYGDGATTLDGGADTDILRFGGGYDLSNTVITGFETLGAYGNGRLTTAQFGSFALVMGYDAATTYGSVVLTAGGTATVVLSNTMTSNFTITGSSGSEKLTFDPSYLYTIYAYLGSGNDRISSASGNDSLRGDWGNDSLLGNNGDDSLDGGLGADSLSGGAGNDFLICDTGDLVFGGADDDLISVRSNGVASISGGAGNDSLRMESSYDLSSTAISVDVEVLQSYGSTMLTTAQLDQFKTVMGYNASTTSATVVLTAGGTASVTLAASLASTFSIYGSGQSDLVTFAPGHAGAIYAQMGLGNDSLGGSDGNDTLYGEQGNDTLNGAAGNDVLDGGDGQDLLIGGGNDDYLVMRTGDSGQGGAGNDMLSVEGSFPVSLDGGQGAGDILRFASSYDITGATLIGIEQLNLYGQDSMTANQLNSFLRVQGYYDSTTSATVTLTQGGTVALHLQNFLTAGFNLQGSGDADLVTVDATYLYAYAAYGYGGNDSLTGGSGNDALYGGLGADSLYGGGGNDLLVGGDSDDLADVMFGGAGNDTVQARAHDIVSGDGGADLIDVLGNDVASIDGGLGTDIVRMTSSLDLSNTILTGVEQLNLNYGSRLTATQMGQVALISGYDTPYTSTSLVLTAGGTATATFDGTLTAGVTITGSVDADILTFVTSVSTNLTVNSDAGNDSITGSLGRDSLTGGFGDDTLAGGDGNDTLDGGVGTDSLLGGNGNDVLYGRNGSRLFGGNDSDLLSVYDNGVKVLNGGAGQDTLRNEGSYDLSGATIAGVETLAANGVYLTTAQLGLFGTVMGYSAGNTSMYIGLTSGGTANVKLSATLTAGVTVDGASDAENLTFNAAYAGAITFNGSGGNDVISAGAGNDVLYGGSGGDSLTGLLGNDYLSGGIGRDTLVGGAGIDTLVGGSGQDVFVFDGNTVSPLATPDTIQDFEGAGIFKGDIIDVSAIDADGAAGLQDSFIFGSTGIAGLSLAEDGSGNTLVRMNIDADADFEIVVKITDGGVLASAYTAADFNL